MLDLFPFSDLAPVCGAGWSGEEMKQGISCSRQSPNTGCQMEKDHIAKRVAVFADLEERNSLFACGWQLKGIISR